MRLRLLFIFLSIAALAGAQERKITPVDIDDNKPKQPTLHYYDEHGEPLKEPVLFLVQDTIQKPTARPLQPLYNGVSVGVNVFDGLMAIAGQRRYSFDLWADVSLHNWFFPVVEAGVGWGRNQPLDANFLYKAKPSPYVKVGINYNFLYKSNPAYQAFLGLRACWTTSSYDVLDCTVSSDYWGERNTFDITGQRASAFFGEVLFGIKVKIVGPFSMGWTGRYHFNMRQYLPANSQPWFLPGYGTSGPLSATFSLIYTI